MRHLAAILLADVVGFTGLMESDEAGTISSLKSHRDALIDPKTTQYNGRLVKVIGDALLLEFSSVVEAVQFAVEVQASMQQRNKDIPEDKKIVFRIGINLGDVVAQGDDILGDGVNLTARLEAHAEPGGICLSGSAHDQLPGKLDISFEALGPVSFKNITKPVQVYRITIDEKARALVTPVVRVVPGRSLPGTARIKFASALAVVLLLISAGVYWWQPWNKNVEPVRQASMVLALPDKPSIVVLPFENFSDDPAQDYFIDGMTDDLLTGLSQLPDLFVISRNTSFTYKDRAVNIRDVAEELGVQYVLEGSVRRSDDQIRINVQLIDALSGYHVWAKKYDRQMQDVFALQDQVVGNIISSMAANLVIDMDTALQTDNPRAYDLYLQGREFFRANTPEDFSQAIKLFDQSLKEDADYIRVHAALAAVYWNIFDQSWAERAGVTTTEAVDLAKKHLSVALREPNAEARQVSAKISLWSGDHGAALTEIKQAIDIEPNDADSYSVQSRIQIYSGMAEEAELSARAAMRLNPHYPATYLQNLGFALFHQDRFEEALEVLKRARNRDPDLEWNYTSLTAIYGHLGLLDEARQALDKFISLRKNSEGGKFTVQSSADWTPYRNKKDLERLQEGLRKAGVPDAVAVNDTDFMSLVTKSDSGFTVEGVRTIDLEEARQLQEEGILFVDTRSKSYLSAHIPGALWLDYKTELTAENLGQIAEKYTQIVFYCDGVYCFKSAYSSAKATLWGYTDVLYFAGGMPAWSKAGYPTEPE